MNLNNPVRLPTVGDYEFLKNLTMFQDIIIKNLQEVEKLKCVEISNLENALKDAKAEAAQLKIESDSKLALLKNCLKGLHDSISIEETAGHSPHSMQTEARESKSSMSQTSTLQAEQSVHSEILNFQTSDTQLLSSEPQASHSMGTEMSSLSQRSLEVGDFSQSTRSAPSVHFQYNPDPVGITDHSGCKRNSEQKAALSDDDEVSTKKTKRQRTES